MKITLASMREVKLRCKSSDLLIEQYIAIYCYIAIHPDMLHTFKQTRYKLKNNI